MKRGPEIPAKGGEEYDMLSPRSRRMLHHDRGRSKKAKKTYNRRVRRMRAWTKQ